MDLKTLNFLNKVLGEEGASAIKKAVDYSKDLHSALLPRVILSWLEFQSKFNEFNGEIPGSGLNLNFKKSDSGNYYGHIEVEKDSLYKFENIDTSHLAASLAIALGAKDIQQPKKDIDIVNLGKSIDLLIKSKFLSDFKKTDSPPSKIENKPEATVRKSLNSKLKVLKIKKFMLTKACSFCNQGQLDEEGNLVGCMCLTDLIKNVEVEEHNSLLLIKADKLDNDSFMTLVDVFLKY